MFSLPRPALIGVVHLPPLPGSPRWGGSMNEVLGRALADATAYVEGGADALVLENFHDLPFTAGRVPAETVAAMAVVGGHLRDAGQVTLPVGYNVLRNDALSALALAAAAGGAFIRVNVHSGAMLTDQGIINGDAFATLRARARLCPEVAILADVQVKHAYPLAAMSLAQSARDTLERGLADGLIISGQATGASVDLADLQEAREACPAARIFVGSGATVENAARLLRHADGLIVGSSLKRDGVLANPVDAARVRRLRAEMDSARS